MALESGDRLGSEQRSEFIDKPKSVPQPETRCKLEVEVRQSESRDKPNQYGSWGKYRPKFEAG